MSVREETPDISIALDQSSANGSISNSSILNMLAPVRSFSVRRTLACTEVRDRESHFLWMVSRLYATPIPVERLDGLLVGVHLKDLGGRDVGYWNPRDCPWLRW
jgi:hypothetical protein